MAYGAYFKANGNTTEVWLGGEWEERIELTLRAKDMALLGKKLIRLADGWRKGFVFTLEGVPSSLTVTAKRCHRNKMPLLTFEYEDVHPHFESRCTNTFYYDSFSLSEIAELGQALLEYQKSGFAFIGDIK